MKHLKSYRVFEFEIKELIKFLGSTKYAFAKVKTLKKFTRDQNHKQYLEDNGFDTSPSGICKFNNSSVLILEKTLNQQTLVRAISALEIFLIDIFRDVFILTKKPFKDQSKSRSYSQSHLLSIKSISELFNEIINRECRGLSSDGFEGIIKAYKNRLKIDLLNIYPGKQKMVEYHEIRHLIIHKLGRTDEKFRKKYKVNNAGIHVGDEYLSSCIADIKGFAEQTHKLVLNRINELTTFNPQHCQPERKVKCHIEILTTCSNVDFLDPDFEFWVNDEFEVLKNILIEKKSLIENEFKITLAGTKRQIKAYFSRLKFEKKRRNINLNILENIVEGITETNSTNNEVPKKVPKKDIQKPIPIEESTIELIRQQLPEQPWETGIHKKVAKKIGLANKTVSNVIKILINRGDFKQQVDGTLIEDSNLNKD